MRPDLHAAPSRRAPRPLSDRGAVALAAGAAVGALVARPVALPIALAVVLGALALRRPLSLVGGVALLASSLGATATAGLTAPVRAHVDTEVTLLGDPVAGLGGVRAEVRAGGRRVELAATGAAAGAVADRLTGERLRVSGTIGPLPGAVADRLGRRHVSARLVVDEVGPGGRAALVHRLANGLRRTLSAGARPLGGDRPLFLGMVVGDDRDQSPLVASDFRGAGLTHLLAVSGQNVAFALVLIGPLLRRLGLRSRWAATVVAIAFFALLTRFEPSVLRASAMAAVACTGHLVGRPARGIRPLALAATAVLLLDPFLVRSVGFLLSCGASAGIVLLARPLAQRLPGPRPLAELLGVTVAAQVGVAPVLLPVFGGLPLASLPANVLAVPVAGPIMTWGLTGGMLAGVVGPPVDGWLHLPTGLLVGWIGLVARRAADLPLGVLGVGEFVALGVAVSLGVLGRRWRPACTVPVAVGIAALALVGPATAAPSPLDGTDGGSGLVLWRRGGAVVALLDEPWLPGVLDELRAAGVDRIDVLVLRRGGRTVAGTVLDLRSRVDVRLVLAPAGNRVLGAVVPPAGDLSVGPFALRITDVEPTLELVVRPP